MKSFMVTLVLMIFIMSGVCYSLDFKITEVIPIGPISSGGIKPTLWSPDGTKLAYFSGGQQLIVADTMGNNTTIITDENLTPSRFQWLSNKELIVYQWDSIDRRSRTHQMYILDIETKTKEVIEECIDVVGENEPREFDGPYLTYEGNAYYTVKLVTGFKDGRTTGDETIILPESKYKEKSLTQDNHILRTGTDALYLVKADFFDSIKISNKPYKGYISTVLSPDTQYVMLGGVIVRLKDDHLYILDTLSIDIPKGAVVCGYGDHSFNPFFSEVLFHRSCDNGNQILSNNIGVYDYETLEFTFLDEFLDDMVDLKNCGRPQYAPDGKMITFISAGVIYMMKREIYDVQKE